MLLSVFVLLASCASHQNPTKTALKPCCWEKASPDNTVLYIYQDALRNADRASFLNVHLMPLQELGNVVFKIRFELDKNQILNKPLLKLSRNHKALNAADFVQHRGNEFVLKLPDLIKTDVIEFAIGWHGARPEQHTAVFELVTANQTTLGQWKGWAAFPRSGDNWQYVRAINEH